MDSKKEFELQEMGEAGATPGVVAWTSVIAAWVNAADMQEARARSAATCVQSKPARETRCAMRRLLTSA